MWVFGLPKWWSWEICSSRILCSLIGCLLWCVSISYTGLIFESRWSKQLATDTQWLSKALQKIWIFKFFTICWPSNGNICSQHFTVIHYTFPPWLLVRNSSSATLFSVQRCFLNNFFFTKFSWKFSLFFDPSSYSPHIQSGIEYTQSLVNFKLTQFFMLETAKTYQKLVTPPK